MKGVLVPEEINQKKKVTLVESVATRGQQKHNSDKQAVVNLHFCVCDLFINAF